MPRKLKLALQIVATVVISTTLSTIAITVFGARIVAKDLLYTPPAIAISTGDAARALMQGVTPDTDSTLSPEAAGLLYRGLLPMLPTDARSAPHPTLREVAIFAMPWEGVSRDTTLFPDVRSAGRIDRNKLFAAQRRRLSPEERAMLANVADDSLWRDFGRLARAARLDLAAASFTLPIDPIHPWFELPVPRLSRAQALSDGVAFRALHFLSAGQRDSAEAMIGALYAIGRRVDADALWLIEAMFGQRMAMNALELRRGLHEAAPRPGSEAIVSQIAAIRQTGDSIREVTLAARRAAADDPHPRERMVQMATDPSASRALRLEMLGGVGYTSCGSLRELFFGPGERLQAARTDAMANLAYSAADTAYLTYLERQTTEARIEEAGGTWFDRVLRTTGSALSAVTTNPRFRACTDLLAAAGML